MITTLYLLTIHLLSYNAIAVPSCKFGFFKTYSLESGGCTIFHATIGSYHKVNSLTFSQLSLEAYTHETFWGKGYTYLF